MFKEFKFVSLFSLKGAPQLTNLLVRQGEYSKNSAKLFLAV